MKLTAFVIHVSNPFGVDQTILYYEVLQYFDIVDAVMSVNGDCLAICIGIYNYQTKLPKCYERYIAARPHAKTILKIIEEMPYKNVELLQNKVYNIVEKYNNNNIQDFN